MRCPRRERRRRGSRPSVRAALHARCSLAHGSPTTQPAMRARQLASARRSPVARAAQASAESSKVASSSRRARRLSGWKKQAVSHSESARCQTGSRRARCATSWANIALRSSSASSASARGGTHTAGRSQPIDSGAASRGAT
jgi:hypothetical protein